MNTAAAAPADSRWQRLDRRRVYIFPSRPGFTLGIILVIILLGAINYDNALGYLLSFLLGGLLMVAMLHTYRNLAGLRYLGARAQPVFAGETATFECLLDNDGAKPRLELFVKRWPRGTTREERRYLRRYETCISIPARQTGVAMVAVDAPRRGLQALDRITLHTFYPLGILRAWAYFDTDASCVVYPHPHGDRPLPFSHATATGASVAADLGAEEFAGLRRYSAGDPVRAIAWKTLAKGHDLMIKRFHGQATAELWLDWEALRDLAGVEAKLSQLAAWVLAAHQAGMTFGLELPGTHIEPGAGIEHREQCLRALALYEGGA